MNNLNRLKDINDNNIIGNKKYNDITNIITQRTKRNLIKNLSKDEMDSNNSQNFIQVDQVDKNDKISGLINIKDSKSFLEKDKLNNIKEKYSKNIINDKKCFICERTYSILNIFCSKCNIHFFCKDCLKQYYQNLIEKGIKRMKCPIFKCNYDIDNIILEKILERNYTQMLFNLNNDETNNKMNDKKFKNNYNDKKGKLILEDNHKKYEIYQKKNVFQIDANISLSKIKKYEEENCPNCHEQSLFCLTVSFYNKCLNCGYRYCKYCNKPFSNIHLIRNDPRNCKVYYRKNSISFQNSNNICLIILIQILYVVSIFLIMQCFCFLTITKFFLLLFGLEKDKNKKSSFCIFFTLNIFSYCFTYLIYIQYLT